MVFDVISCICNNVSSSTIERLVEEGKNLAEIVEITQVGACCGVCRDGICGEIQEKVNNFEKTSKKIKKTS